MIARQPRIDADGAKNIRMTGVRNKKGCNYFDLLSDAVVHAANRLDAKQEHRSFRDNLLANEPILFFSSGPPIRRLDLDDSSNRPVCHIESVNDAPDQVGPVPSSC